MESIDPVWLFGSIALVAGVFLGILGNRLLSPSSDDIDKLQIELVQAREEMALYKTNVNSHFSKTSDLVNELTQDYVKVYQHLAEGAQTLSDTREFTQVLNQPEGQVLITVINETDEDTAAIEEPAAEVANVAEVTEPVKAVEVEEPPSAPADYAKVDEEVDEKVSVAAEAVKADAESADNTAADASKNIDEGPSKEKDAENADATVTAAPATAAENQSATAPAAESKPEKKT